MVFCIADVRIYGRPEKAPEPLASGSGAFSRQNVFAPFTASMIE